MLDETTQNDVAAKPMAKNEEMIAKRKALGLSQAQLADLAGHGVQQQDVQRIEKGATKFSKHMVHIDYVLNNPKELQEVIGKFKKYNTYKEALEDFESSPAMRMLKAGREESLSANKSRPEPKFFGERDFYVYGAVEGGPGEFVRNNDPIEIVPRPWYMRDVHDGFGVVVIGESMLNKYEPGNIVIVNPSLTPIRGKAAIFVADGEGEFRATLKMYRSQDERSWKVTQLNPEKDFNLDKAVWNKAYRVVGTYEGY